MTHLMVVDHGYFNSKGYDGEEFACIRTKYIESEEPPSTEDTHQIIFEGKTYQIGSGGTKFDIDLDKTSSFLHRLTTFTVLGLMGIREDLNRINLVALYPLANYRKENKEAFRDFLVTPEPVPIILNGWNIKIEIVDAIICPQCFVAQYINPSLFKNQLTGIIDFGGLTVQGCITDSLNLVPDSIFSVNLGSIILYSKIRKHLNKVYNLSLKDYHIPHIISQHMYKVEIAMVLWDHFFEIRQEMKLAGWDINMPLYITGGGSILLKDYLPGEFPNSIISETPLKDNVLGAYKVGEYYYAKNPCILK